VVDVVLAADCIYAEEAIPVLLETFEALSTPDHTSFLIANKRRSKIITDLFFALLKNHFQWQEVTLSMLCDQPDDYFFLLAKRKV